MIQKIRVRKIGFYGELEDFLNGIGWENVLWITQSQDSYTIVYIGW